MVNKIGSKYKLFGTIIIGLSLLIFSSFLVLSQFEVIDENEDEDQIDFNGDGIIDIRDIEIIEIPPGDLNGDLAVDLSDAVFLLGHLFQGGPVPAGGVRNELNPLFEVLENGVEINEESSTTVRCPTATQTGPRCEKNEFDKTVPYSGKRKQVLDLYGEAMSYCELKVAECTEIVSTRTKLKAYRCQNKDSHIPKYEAGEEPEGIQCRLKFIKNSYDCRVDCKVKQFKVTDGGSESEPVKGYIRECIVVSHNRKPENLKDRADNGDLIIDDTVEDKEITPITFPISGFTSRGFWCFYKGRNADGSGTVEKGEETTGLPTLNCKKIRGSYLNSDYECKERSNYQ
jgi:hypothetical protein